MPHDHIYIYITPLHGQDFWQWRTAHMYLCKWSLIHSIGYILCSFHESVQYIQCMVKNIQFTVQIRFCNAVFPSISPKKIGLIACNCLAHDTNTGATRAVGGYDPDRKVTTTSSLITHRKHWIPFYTSVREFYFAQDM